MMYATIEDLEKRWKRLTEPEKEKAEALIREASSKIRLKARNEHKDFDTMMMNDSDLAEVVAGLVCGAVRSAMAMRSDAIGVSQYSASVGGYSESMSFSNPSGGIRFTNKDWLSIGLGRQKYGGVDLYGMDRQHRSDCFTPSEDCDRL